MKRMHRHRPVPRRATVASAGVLSLLVALLMAVIPLSAAGAQSGAEAGSVARQVPASAAQVQLSYAPLVKNAAPAVVNIYTKRVVQQRRSALFDDPIFRRFFGDRFSFGAPQERVRGSLGSGVIVRDTGVIITNNHVIEEADEIRVILADRREFDAELVLADPRTDLAILKITLEQERLPALDFANSDDVEVGDLVLAIGNPFGIGQTVTSGIVSATARTQVGISDFGFFIQTDAAVNPGNSGGALVGVDGTLIGINTAIYSRSGGSNGIGFAVPANMVQAVLQAALDDGRIIRPWLGLKGQNVSADLATALGLDRPGGVLVNAIFPGGPAERAGLRTGDVILAINGKEVIDEPGLNFRVATLREGDQASLAVVQGGSLQEVPVRLSLPPEVPSRRITELDGGHPFQGVTVANLSPAFNDELQVDPFVAGVVVLEIGRTTPSARFQFVAPGDLIRRVNGTAIETVTALIASLAEPRERYVYQIERRGQLRECVIVPNRSFRCSAIR